MTYTLNRPGHIRVGEHKMIFLAILVACGGGSETEPTSTNTTGTNTTTTTTVTTTETWTVDELSGMCALDGSTRVGGFEVAHWESFSTVTGNVANGLLPTTVLFPREISGDCQLFQKEYPFCDPGCEAGQVCDHNGECIPYPTNQGLGTATVSGITENVVMEADGSNYYWDTQLSFPMFDAGDPIKLQTSGGDIAAFSLRSLGVEFLTFDNYDWVIRSKEDLKLSWTPSKSPSRILIDLNVDQHGNSPVSMVCDTADDGEISIDAGMLETLLMYGVSGFATATARRYVADSAMLDPGCVELLTYHHVEGNLSVDGHQPCFSDADCPDGQVCDVPINTCVDE